MTDINGLELWYDSSDISTLWQDSSRTTPVTATDDPVGAWDDKSGNGGHALQSTAANKPTYKVNASGNATSLYFDGGDWLDNTAYIPSTVPVTMFAVFQCAVGNTGTIISIVNSGDTGRYHRLLIRSTGEGAYNRKSAGGEDMIDTAPSVFDDGANHVITGMETSTIRGDVWVNGGDNNSGTSTVASVSADTVSIGRNSDFSPSSEWDDYILEIIVYDTPLTDANRQSVEAYLMTKWGIS